MNGWSFAAVAVVCVTVLGATLLWALVRLGQQSSAPAAVEELAQGRTVHPDLLRRAAEAAQRSGRGRDGR
ncbi:hypothetical protein ABT167_28735 [Streptomyces sp. NPDC001792]|uniref:hypothetical protein n=1 Tax=Streptomyces sp. NPDC001792 TaxID=3154524 RepID=UPI003318A431